MPLKTNNVWAIDLGSYSLKAIRLTETASNVQVVGFDNIKHPKILAGSGINEQQRDEIIALSLRKFLERNEVAEDEIIVSIPGNNSFARFVNLPPVESKRIPEIVQFEAAQQIPFDINEVQWDWQLMEDAKQQENRVGIFAVKNEIINELLARFDAEGIVTNYVQIAPMALYNFLLYDRPDFVTSDKQATVILNIGAENTDLVVCTRSGVWQRSIPMGGNSFTHAIADTFKLSFQKAEKLKRTAPMSKYARQILQAMKPVFTDLASEIQRSLGFYTNSNPNVKLARIVALGGGTRMRGLLKYLQQTLQMPIARPDSFKKIQVAKDVSAAKFHENVFDFGIVYGLALQALGFAKIESNLLPANIARAQEWTVKAKYFTAASIILLIVSVMAFARGFLDKATYQQQQDVRNKIKQIVNTADEATQKLKNQKQKAPEYEETINAAFQLLNYRQIIPQLKQTILSMLPNEKYYPRQKQLYQAFKNQQVRLMMETPRKKRKQIFVTGFSAFYTDSVEQANLRTRASRTKTSYGEPFMPGETTTKSDQEKEQTDQLQDGPGFVVTITGYSPYEDIVELLDPIGVENVPDKWGFITRLAHLDEIAGPNSPFILYKRGEPGHFERDTGPVDTYGKTPQDILRSIGIIDYKTIKSENVGYAERKSRNYLSQREGYPFPTKTTKDTNQKGKRKILKDPMTKEIISMEPLLDEQGRPVMRRGEPVFEENDHWFEIQCKFIWKNAPNNGSSGY